MRIVSNSKISRHDGFKIAFSSFQIKTQSTPFVEENNKYVTANLDILLSFENLNLLSTYKPKLRVLSIALKVKQFLGSKEVT